MTAVATSTSTAGNPTPASSNASWETQSTTAKAYSNTNSYLAGTIVIYDDKPYICEKAIAANPLDAKVWSLIPAFDAADPAYLEDDRVTYNSELYKRLASTTPAGSSNYWLLIPTFNAAHSAYLKDDSVTDNNEVYKRLAWTSPVTLTPALTEKAAWEKVVTPAFSKTTSYNADSYVSYSDKFYKCLRPVTLTPALTVTEAWTKVVSTNFSTTTSYNADSYVSYLGEIYNCVHPVSEANYAAVPAATNSPWEVYKERSR